MIVSFIGSPSSGKTTLAAKLFVYLKTNDYPCELLTEQARLVIAKIRYDEKLKVNAKLQLFDKDQRHIMQQQLKWENILGSGMSSRNILVTDSSPFNSLLYLTYQGKEDFLTQPFIKIANQTADLVFYVKPIANFVDNDPNRIHDQKQSRNIDVEVRPTLRAYAPDIEDRLVVLDGDFEYRTNKLITTVAQIHAERELDYPAVRTIQ